MLIFKSLNIFGSILVASAFLYMYIDGQNELTELRLQIPELAKELKEIQEENIRLKYEIKQFESPVHLLELSQQPEFGYLKYPFQDQVIIRPLE